MSVFDVLDAWFNSPHFRGCAFINATVELADPAHPAHAPVLAHKRRNREYLAELAGRAGVVDVEAFSRQLMLLVGGSIITALVQRDFDAAKDAKRVARALLEAARVEGPVRASPRSH